MYCSRGGVRGDQNCQNHPYLAKYKVSGKRHAPDGFGQRARWKLHAPAGNLKKRHAPRGSQNPSSALLPAGAGPPLDLTKNIITSGACLFHP